MADERHSTAHPAPPRVLLVESAAPAREAITEALGGLGLSIARAASAEAALRAARASPEPPRRSS
jgi:CheY-like chemotaxis protein